MPAISILHHTTKRDYDIQSNRETGKEYLQQVITTIHDTINTTSTSVKEHIDTLQEYKDYLWSNKDIDPHEIRSMRESILNHFALGENVIDKRRRLSKILDTPYFGRIDFQEKKDKSQVSPIYIGIHTFYDLNQKNLIYDWRAPISSMFYDHELGEAFYSSRQAKLTGRSHSNANIVFAKEKWST